MWRALVALALFAALAMLFVQWRVAEDARGLSELRDRQREVLEGQLRPLRDRTSAPPVQPVDAQPADRVTDSLRPMLAAARTTALADDAAFPRTELQETTATLALMEPLAPGTLMGWVADPAGQPVRGAMVRASLLVRLEEEPVGSPLDERETTTDAAGNFIIEGAAAGTWAVEARARGFGSAWNPDVVLPPGRASDPVALRLTPSTTITGRVRSLTGDPVVGASVGARRQILVYDSEGSPNRLTLPATDLRLTDGEGRFQLEDLSPGQYRLQAAMAGFAHATATVLLDSDGESVDLTLAPEAPFAVQVRGRRDEAIEGARLVLRAADAAPGDQPLARAETNAAGEHTFRGLAAGQMVDITVTASGYAPAGPIRLQTGTLINRIQLGGGGSIEGRVWTTEGDRRSGLRIVARPREDERRRFVTVTRADGRYRVANLAEGTYDVWLEEADLVAEARTAIRVELGRRVTDVDFAAYLPLSVRGWVVDSATGQRVAAAQVELKAQLEAPGLGTPRRRVIASSGGEFRFDRLPAGLYQLRGSASGYQDAVPGRTAVEFMLNRQTQAIERELVLEPAGRVRGVVVDARTGVVVPGAMVTVAPWMSAPRYRREADSGGRFFFGELPIGGGVEVRVMAEAAPFARGISEPLTLTTLESDHEVEVRIGEGASVAVRVLTVSGAAVEGATVMAVPEPFPKPRDRAFSAAITDANGRAVFATMPSTPALSLRAEHPSFAPAQLVVAHPAGTANGPIVLRLQPAAAIVGRVVDDLGQPFRRGRVRAMAMPPIVGAGEAAIDRDGGFRIEPLPLGTYTVEVEVQRECDTGLHSVVRRLEDVPAGGVGELQVVVPFNGAIEGRVLEDESSKPIPSFRVTLTGKVDFGDGTTPLFFMASTFSGGRYRFTNLPPGRYRVEASAPGRLNDQSDNIVVTSPQTTDAGILRLREGGFILLRAMDLVSGQPVSGASATALPVGTSALSDARGEIRLGPLEPGLYDIGVSHPDYSDTEVSLVRVVAGAQINEGDVLLRRGAGLDGQVVDGRGRPVSGASVTARSPGEERRRTTRTDRGGRFAFRGLKPGSVLLTARARLNGVSSHASTSVAVSPDRPGDARLVLRADGKLRGLLLPPPGADVARSSVEIIPLEVDQTPILGERFAVPQSRGSFEARNLPRGSYLILAQAPYSGTERTGTAYWFETARLTGDLAEVVVMPGPLSLEGLARQTRDGAPVPGQVVRLGLLTAPHSGIASLSGWWQRVLVSNGAGAFRAELLPEGTYRLSATNDGFGGDVLEVFGLGVSRLNSVLSLHFQPTPGIAWVTPGVSSLSERAFVSAGASGKLLRQDPPPSDGVPFDTPAVRSSK